MVQAEPGLGLRPWLPLAFCLQGLSACLVDFLVISELLPLCDHVKPESGGKGIIVPQCQRVGRTPTGWLPWSRAACSSADRPRRN